LVLELGPTEDYTMRLLASTCLIALISVGSAWAQASNPPAREDPGIGNPAGMSPDKTEAAQGAPASHQPNTADRGFARAAAMGGAAEVAFGRLASQRGQSPAIREFGERMVADHTRANDQLLALANTDRIALPKAPDAEHQAMLERLTKAQGNAFDRDYIHGQIVDHQMTAQLLGYEIGSGEDPQLKAFASQTLPVVLQHLRMAQRIDAQLSGAGEPQAAISEEQHRAGGAGAPGSQIQR
jgi:putative membrane protein